MTVAKGDINPLEEAVHRIKAMWGSHELSYEELFETGTGKRLGKQLADIQEFTVKCIVMALLGRIIHVFPKLMAWLTSEEFDHIASEAKEISRDDSWMINTFQDLIRRNPEWHTEVDDLEWLIQEEEQMRFVAYELFASCAYLDAFAERFTKDLQKLVLSAPRHYSQKYSLEVIELFRKIIKTERRNFKQRLEVLNSGLQLKAKFGMLLREHELEQLPGIVGAIIEFRHIIAHEQPFPDVSVLDEDKIQAFRNHLRHHLPPIVVEKQENMPEGLEEIFEYLMGIFLENRQILAMTDRIPRVLACYAAFIEVLIHHSLK
ncbi:MAG: hypothetical protein ACXAB4_12230 [Candidatus Hodarchaeales archaeon]|jgi:hypothetical protein